MNFSNLGIAVCLTAGVIGAPSYAGEHRKETQAKRQQASSMRAVSVTTRPGEPAHGWQYFSDARATRAVVISASGDYYYSHGEGLELVFKASKAA